MKIIVHENDKIADIQRSFNEKYKYLRIEFFKEPHEKEKGSELSSKVDEEVLIKDVSASKNGEVSIEFFPSTTVAQLEKRMFDVFGLSVQVYRKSGKIWLQTTTTDSWTLKEQNDHAQGLD